MWSTSLTLTPLVGLSFTGASLTEHDDLAPGTASLGTPVWNPPALLSNLELRLGLASTPASESIRVQRFARRLDDLLATAPRFYARSFDADRLGTATMLLTMRDALVTAGWNGAPIEGGGERLDTFVALETDTDLPPGDADRLRAVEIELRASSDRPFDALHLAEPIAAWPGRWQRIFALLDERGVPVRHVVPSFDTSTGNDDLANLQAVLRGDAPRCPLRGDGSLVLVRGETSWALAATVAAWLRVWSDARAVIVRGGDVSALDHALVGAGLGSQGLSSPSAWRPMLQVLPLAIELVFEPRDPYRVLELLTLPAGPFHGLVGGALSRALAASPGIGGRAWRQAKEHVAKWLCANDATDGETRARATLAMVEEWLERPGHSARDGAPRSALSETAMRVCEWLREAQARLQRQCALDPGDHGRSRRLDVALAAVAQAEAFHDALEHDTRGRLDLVDARLLLEQVSAPHALPLVDAQAGRLDAADAPSMLRASRDVVVWWHCVAGTEWRPNPRPWRAREVTALRDAGVLFADLALRLATEADAWRQVVLAARCRLVLVLPQWGQAAALEPHPIVHEIAARLDAHSDALARITVDMRDMLADGGRSIATARPAAMVDLGARSLPEARSDWRVPEGMIATTSTHSASSLEEMIGCPLRWVLARCARLRAGDLASINSGPVLQGTLGHRVVEELHREGALAQPEDVLERFPEIFDRLLDQEAAVLRRAGMTFERTQMRAVLRRSVHALSTSLANAGLRVVDVESRMTVPWRGRELVAHIDVLLVDERGGEVVLDLKWGGSRYPELLRKGRSVQLAAYVAARRLAGGGHGVPRGAYFSLKQGKTFATESIFGDARPIEGPSLADTWSKVESTVERVERALHAGHVPVTGVSRALPLIDALRAHGAENDQHLDLPKGDACAYCAFDAICGRRWEALA